MCDQHAVREPEGGVLPEVGDLGAPAGAVADRGHDLVGGVADDDPDLLDPGLDHVFDAVEEDRLVGDRHELLRARVGDRPEPGAGAAGEDQTLHRRSMVGGTLPVRCVLRGAGRRVTRSAETAPLSCRRHDGFRSFARFCFGAGSLPGDVARGPGRRPRDLRARAGGVGRSARRPRARPPRDAVPTAWDPRIQPIADEVAEAARARRSSTRSPPSSSTTPRSRSRSRSTRASSASRTSRTSSGRRASSAPSGSSAPTSTSSTPSSSLQASGVLAYYDPKTKKITVKGTNLDDVADAGDRRARAHARAAGPALRPRRSSRRRRRRRTDRPRCTRSPRATRCGSRTTT